MTDGRQSGAWANTPVRADHRARTQRDAGLERLGSITKAIAAASVAAVAVIGIYVSRAVPGHSTTPTNAGAGTVSGGSAAATQGGGSQGAQPNGLSQPNNPPAQSQQQAPVVSGST
jgi:hypothetical protein